MKKEFIDLTDLPKVRKEITRNIRVLFRDNHPYHKIKRELEKLTEKERSTLDLLQLFRVWGKNTNREIAEVIRLNSNYYLSIFSSLCPKVYHSKKNGWLIFSLLAGIASISKYEPIKLTDNIYNFINTSLVDSRKSIRRQALSVILASMYPSFGTESSIKPIFRKKILRENLATALNYLIKDINSKNNYVGILIATTLQSGLSESGIMITSQIPYTDEAILEDFKRWFNLKEIKAKE